MTNEQETPLLDGPVLMQGSLRTALRSQRQTSSLDLVLMANARQGVIDQNEDDDKAGLTCLRDLLAEQHKSPQRGSISPNTNNIKP